MYPCQHEHLGVYLCLAVALSATQCVFLCVSGCTPLDSEKGKGGGTRWGAGHAARDAAASLLLLASGAPSFPLPP